MDVGSESWCAKEGLGGVGLNLKWGLVLLPYIEDGDGSFPSDHLQLQGWTSTTSRHYGCEKQETPSTGQNAPRSWSKNGPMKNNQFSGSSVTSPILDRCAVLLSIPLELLYGMAWTSKNQRMGRIHQQNCRCRRNLPGFSFLKGAVWSGEAWDGQPVSRSKKCPLDQRFTRFYKLNIWHNIDIWWLACIPHNPHILGLCITIVQSICCTEFHVCCRSEVSNVRTNSMVFKCF